MTATSKSDRRSDPFRPAAFLPGKCAAALLCLTALPAAGQDIYSIQVDRGLQKIIVNGVDLDLATTVTLGGVTVLPTAPAASALMEIPFAAEVYNAVQWEGSYNLVLDGSERLSVYIDGPIEAPPPPPPPPGGGSDCSCIPGWSANASIIADNWAYCQPVGDGNQTGYVASSTTAILPGPTPWALAVVYDFDDPGIERSFCVLDVNMDGSYEVGGPVTNVDQYNDCINWLFRELVCL